MKSEKLPLISTRKLPSVLRERFSNVTRVFGADDIDQTSLMLKFRDAQFPMQPDIFLQVNPGLWKAMIQEVESHFENSPSAVVAEFYCGAGFFTVVIAHHVQKIYASEENQKAIEFAKSPPQRKKHRVDTRAS